MCQLTTSAIVVLVDERLLSLVVEYHLSLDLCPLVVDGGEPLLQFGVGGRRHPTSSVGLHRLKAHLAARWSSSHGTTFTTGAISFDGT